MTHKLELWLLFATTCLYAYHVASTIHPPEYRNLSLKEVVCGSQTKRKIMFWHVTDCTHLICQFWAGSKYPDKKLHFLKTNVDLCFVTSSAEKKKTQNDFPVYLSKCNIAKYVEISWQSSDLLLAIDLETPLLTAVLVEDGWYLCPWQTQCPSTVNRHFCRAMSIYCSNVKQTI